MEAIRRVFKFGLGGTLGAVVGAGIASLLAPQTGEELQRNSHAFLDDVKAEGDRARQETESELSEKYRVQVADPKALTGDTEHYEPKMI